MAEVVIQGIAQGEKARAFLDASYARRHNVSPEEAAELNVGVKLIDALAAPEEEDVRNAVRVIMILQQGRAPNADAMCNAGILPHLFTLLTSSTRSVDAKKLACLALANLATSPVLQVTIADAGGFAALLSVIDATASELVEQALKATLHLALNEKNHDKAAGSGLISALMRLMHHEEVRIVERALKVLYVLGDHEGNRSRYVREGLFVPLVDVMNQYHTAEFALMAINLLVNLLANGEHHDAFLKAGGLFSAAKLLSVTEKADVRHSLLMALGNLTQKPEQVHGAIASLLQVLPMQDETELVFLLRILINVTQEATNRVEFCERGGISAVLQLLSQSSNDILAAALGVITNLAKDLDGIDAICNQGGVESILSIIMRTQDENVKDTAVSALANLAVKSKEENEEVTETEEEEKGTTVHSKILASGTLASLVEMLRNAPERLQSSAALALGTILVNESMQLPFLETGGIELAVSKLLSSSNAEIVYRCARILRPLSFYFDSMRDAVVKAEAVSPILTLLLASTVEDRTRSQVGYTLVNLCLSEKSEAVFSQPEYVSSLVLLLSSSNPTLQEVGVMALSNLSLNNHIRRIVSKVGGVAPALKLADSDNESLQEMSGKLIAHLALDSGTRRLINWAGGMETFKRLEQSTNPSVAQAASMALNNLSFLVATDHPAEPEVVVEDLSSSPTNEADLVQLSVLESRRMRSPSVLFLLEEEARKKDTEAERLKEHAERMRVTEEKRLAEEEWMADMRKKKEKADEETRVTREEEIQKAQKAQAKGVTTEDVEQLRQKEERAKMELMKLKQEVDERHEMEKKASIRRQRDEEAVLFVKETEKQKEFKEAEEKKQKEEEANRPKGSGWRRLSFLRGSKEQISLKQKEIETMRKQRTNIVKEICETEHIYVLKLGLVLKKFRYPMLENARNARRPFFTLDEVKSVFSCIDIIHQINTILNNELDERLKRWHDEACIGAVFLRYTDYLKVYTEYVRNFEQALLTFTRALQNSEFSSFIKKIEETECDGRSFDSLMIEPVQRIPRYVLLLSDLLKHTPSSHPDHSDLSLALEKMMKIATYVNEKKREAENMAKVLKIQQNLHGKIPEDLILPTRRYICETDVRFGTGKKGRVFVFNDALLLVEKAKIMQGLKFVKVLKFSSLLLLTRENFTLIPVWEVELVTERLDLALGAVGSPVVLRFKRSEEKRNFIMALREAMEKLGIGGVVGA